MFIGRTAELSELEELYTTDVFQCVIIYGRRRVGKTTLITEFCKDKPHVFYVAQENNSQVLLRDFSSKIQERTSEKNFQSQFDSWENAFLFLGNEAKDHRLIVVLDEFPYLARADKSIKSVLQNVIDHALKDTRLFLILCGSQVSFMEDEVLGYNSPLYGRRTAQIRLEPFPFAEARCFFPHYSLEDQITAYSIVGGIPLYLAQFSDDVSIEDNIKKRILKKYSYLYEEPRNLLKQELREPMNYNAILEAIAGGASELSKIASKAKLSYEHCPKYINTLIELKLVEKELPLESKPSSRKSVYCIQDSFFLFWYRFVFPHISELEMGLVDEVYQEVVAPELSSFVGHRFEQVCRQHFCEKNRKRELPYPFSRIGRWWGSNVQEKRQEEVDIYAIGAEGVYIGECKWWSHPVDIGVLNDVKRKGQLFNADRITYVLYSKTGFTESVRQAAGSNVLLYDIRAFSALD